MRLDSMGLYRLARDLKSRGVPVLPELCKKLMLFLYTSYVPPTVEIGEETVLGYGGVGLILHARAKIGRCCVISPFVALTGTSGQEAVPQLGDYVIIGVGAKIIGPVKVGDFAVVGANAVVTRDVAPGAVVAGSPAREIRRMADPVAEYEKTTGRRVPDADRHKAKATFEAHAFAESEHVARVMAEKLRAAIPKHATGKNVLVGTSEPLFDEPLVPCPPAEVRVNVISERPSDDEPLGSTEAEAEAELQR